MSEESPSLFGAAANARQLIIRAERQRERQLASLFYETAGRAPGQRKRHRQRGSTNSSSGKSTLRGHKARKRRGTSGTNASTAGGQAFSGTRILQRRKQHTLRKERRKQMRGSHRSVEHFNTTKAGEKNIIDNAFLLNQEQHRIHQNTTPGGTPLMSQSLPVLSSALYEDHGQATSHHPGVQPDRAWDSQKSSDVEMTRFMNLRDAEASLRIPPAPDLRPSVTEGYKTFKNSRTDYGAREGSVNSAEYNTSTSYLSEASPDDMTAATETTRGNSQTLGGFNLPLVNKVSDEINVDSNEPSQLFSDSQREPRRRDSQSDLQNVSQTLPVVIAVASISADQAKKSELMEDQHDSDVGQIEIKGGSSYFDYQMATASMLPPHHLEKSSVSSLYKSLRGQQQRLGISPTVGLMAPRPGSSSSPYPSSQVKNQRRVAPLVEALDPNHPAVAEHKMHHVPGGQPGGAGRRVSPQKHSAVTDRVAGILLLRTEKLQHEIDAAKGGELKLLEKIENGITWSRRSLLPLDFVFRKALTRFRRSHLEVALTRWLAFVRKSRTIEKLLAKVTPYCVKIQKCWRGYLGRKRAHVVREIFRVELEQRREGAATTLQIWWRRQVVKMKIKDRFIYNVERRRHSSASTIQRIYLGFSGRLIARNRFRGARLAPAMHELVKYRHSMEDSEQLEVLKLSSVLFDQRNDDEGAATPGMPVHKQPYTMHELRVAEKKALVMRDKRRRDIRRKKEKWSREAAEDRMELREKLTRLEKERHDAEMERQREHVADVERKRIAEVERVKKAREHIRAMKAKKAKEKMEREQRELERIKRLREEKMLAEQNEEKAKLKREELEKIALARIREQVRVEETAHAARAEAKKRALLMHQGLLKMDSPEVKDAKPHQEVKEEKCSTKEKAMSDPTIETVDDTDLLGKVSSDIMSPAAFVDEETEEIDQNLMDKKPTIQISAGNVPNDGSSDISEAQEGDQEDEGEGDSGTPQVSHDKIKNGESKTSTINSDSVSTLQVDANTQNEEERNRPVEEKTAINLENENDEAVMHDTDGSIEEGESSSPRRGGGELFRIVCVEDFEKDANDELDLKIGDPVTVMNREDPDWWIGENENTGARGTFPASAVKRQGLRVRPRENFAPDPEDEDAVDMQISFEYGDYIEVLDWEDPDWWRGRNLSTGKTGEFPSDLVFLPDEWAAEEAKVKAEFEAEELRLKKDELEKMEKLTRGLAADDRADEDPAGPGTADGRRAMRTLFHLMDWNSNGTIERYDILRAVTLDSDRRSMMIELGLGRLRYWLLPSQWTRLYALLQYEQSCVAKKRQINKLPPVYVRIPVPDTELLRDQKSTGVVMESKDVSEMDEIEQNVPNSGSLEKNAKVRGNQRESPCNDNAVEKDFENSSLSHDSAVQQGYHEISIVVRRHYQRNSRGDAIDASIVNIDVIDDCGKKYRLRLPLKLLRSCTPSIEDLSSTEHVHELARWLAYRNLEMKEVSDVGVVHQNQQMVSMEVDIKDERTLVQETKIEAKQVSQRNGLDTGKCEEEQELGSKKSDRQPVKSKILVYLPLFEKESKRKFIAASAKQQRQSQFQQVQPSSRPVSAGIMAVFGDDFDPAADELESLSKEKKVLDHKTSEATKSEVENMKEIKEAVEAMLESVVTSPDPGLLTKEVVSSELLGSTDYNDIVSTDSHICNKEGSSSSETREINSATSLNVANSVDEDKFKTFDRSKVEHEIRIETKLQPELSKEKKKPEKGAVEIVKRVNLQAKKKKKMKKILPHHAQREGPGSIGFAAFATVLRNPELVAARWELNTRLNRRWVIHEESKLRANEYLATAVDKVDPPTSRRRRAKEAKKTRLANRNNMIRAAVALIEAVNSRSVLERKELDFDLGDHGTQAHKQKGNTIRKDNENNSRRSDDGISSGLLDSPVNAQKTDDAQVFEKEAEVLVSMVDAVTTTRAKLLHFLAVARLPKSRLAKQYELLRPLLASNDGAGGFTSLHPNIVKGLMTGKSDDVVSVRAILPTLGFDSRFDLCTMERLPQFAN